ncbi:hypothetical protein [Polaribacter aquimarinus]|uniref:Adhesin domain-containing protein n=1 Tax=Polaribacter aquimarinus TaxID=2100726 RepID=A0A2U2JBJ4_9FLAO|nr:hypothetical protein [Polaribacter aquimarinus]PWG05709.1 hypothetical protein DIS07_04490 [Polaribacter aquimarinus]
MRIILYLLLFFSTTFVFSQKKVTKKLETSAIKINIYTIGLDDIILEKSESNFVEVFLYAENYDEQLIKILDNNKNLDIKFSFEGYETREVIFRKFITKRLQRANVVVKIPVGKEVYIYGENVDIESKNLKNNLAIYIENGIIKLNKIQANTLIKLYSGNVYGVINSNIDVTSNLGKIEVDGISYKKKYQRISKKKRTDLYIKSIKANIFLTTKKT